MSGFLGVDRYLSTLNGKTATTYIDVVTRTGPKGLAVTGQAEGGSVPKTGKPYADRHLYLLADGEEVISNRHGQADRHRPLLKAINGGLANGGTSGKRRRSFDPIVGGESEAERANREAREAREEARAADAEARDNRAREEAQQRAEHESKMFLAAIEGQERAARGLIDAANEQKASAESVRDGWAQAMERTGSAAVSGFNSDLFGDQKRGLWSGAGGGGGASWFDALTGDISGLREREGLIAQLSGQGISGSALEALMKGSNADISSLLGSGRAGEFAALFAQREALTNSVSGQAGQAAYGTEFAAASAAVAAVDARIQFLESQLAAISAQRPINIYESASAYATAMEAARLLSLQGAA